MKTLWLITLLIIGLVAFNVVAQMSDEHGSSMEGMSNMSDMSGMSEQGSDKARCAYDGMLMKKSAMVSAKYDDKMLYFCSEEQKTAFQKAPKRYLNEVTIGDIHAFMHVLTTKEYMGVMKSMGMDSMVKMDNKATHQIVAYVADEPKTEISGIAIKVIESNGEKSFNELMYNKMLKSSLGGFTLPENGGYKLQLLLESPEVEIK